ncbi:hypothetical protein DICVIV_05411 [Dictyocaulus viviparus]|uniref:Uncharacterized protein n=1 Tax=Dictyocaulus viviparus TaxID=29172 RepID=A0A0D8XVG4_DICVI|nr:hypothetical protein DICVIV_05411 [Dictyocaulus viviparus]
MVIVKFVTVKPKRRSSRTDIHGVRLTLDAILIASIIIDYKATVFRYIVLVMSYILISRTTSFRYCMAAQELASAARGYPNGGNSHRWMMNSGGSASTDDITVFVIPLKYCAAPPLEDDDDDEMISLCAED